MMVTDSQSAFSPRIRPAIDAWLWQWCLARSTWIVLLALGGTAIILMQIIPQSPTQARLNAALYHQWLMTLDAPWGAHAAWLNALGLFSILHSVWFRFLLALGAWASLVGLAHHIRLIWDWPTALPESFSQKQPLAQIDGTHSVSEMAAAVSRVMRRQGRQVMSDQQVDIYGRYPRWLWWYPLSVYLGLLLIIGGLAVDGRWGWRQYRVSLGPDKPLTIGDRSVRRLTLHSVAADGRQAVMAGDDGTTWAVMYGTRVWRDGLMYELTDQGGLAVRLSAQDRQGRPLNLSEYTVRPEPSAWLQFSFSAQGDVQQLGDRFILPDQKMVGQIVWENKLADDADGYRLYLALFDQGEQTLLDGDWLQVGDAPMTFTLAGIAFDLQVSRYVVLNLAYSPGWWSMAAGCIGLGLGVLACLLPRQEVWVCIVAFSGGSRAILRARTYGRSGRLEQRLEAAWSDLEQEIADPNIEAV